MHDGKQVGVGPATEKLPDRQAWRPLRDHQSTTYLAGFESPSDFGVGLRREALRRGMGGVDQVVLLVDGALGLEKMGLDYFPRAIQIVDNYHGLEHLESLIEALLTKADPRRFARRRHHWGKMWHADGGRWHAGARH